MVAAPNPCLAPGRPWAGPPSEKSVVLTGQGSGSLVVRTMPMTHPVKQAGESMESGSATRQTRVVMEGAAADQALAPLPQLDSTSSDDTPIGCPRRIAATSKRVPPWPPPHPEVAVDTRLNAIPGLEGTGTHPLQP